MNMTLQLPNSYCEIKEEEMMYLDGGYRAFRSTYIPAQTRRISRSAYARNLNIGNLLIGAGLSFITGGTGILAMTVSGIASAFFGASGSAALAERADRADGKYDGWVTRFIRAHYVTETNPYPPNSYAGAMF